MSVLMNLTAGLFCLLTFYGCSGQSAPADSRESMVSVSKNQPIGGGCDGCEIMYVGMPENPDAVDTSAGWNEAGQKLIISGTVYQPGGKTPAPGVIIYYWQTDNKGLYSPAPGLDPAAVKHGHIRGWVKTGSDGKYRIYTIRPAPYPGENIPAHIHLSIKEPAIPNEYYVDDLVFDEDPLLIPFRKKYPLENRGGSGILRVLLKGNVQVAEHDIILGLNIPGYPTRSDQKTTSGLNIGEDQPSFIPYHAFGPDKGSRACPVCKYGRFHGIIYFVGNHPDWMEIKQWLSFLEEQSRHRSRYLKVYFVYGNSKDYSRSAREKELERTGEELGLKHVALTFVPSFSDKESEADLNRINPEVENTFVIYRHRRIIDKRINLKPTPDNFSLLSEILDQTKGDYFDLQEPEHQ